MNNFENRCFSLLVDMLTNRPIDLSGRTVLYDNEDRTKYLDIIKSQKIEIEQNKIVPLAQNNANGSYAMGCPTKNGGMCWTPCEIRK